MDRVNMDLREKGLSGEDSQNSCVEASCDVVR